MMSAAPAAPGYSSPVPNTALAMHWRSALVMSGSTSHAASTLFVLQRGDLVGQPALGQRPRHIERCGDRAGGDGHPLQVSRRFEAAAVDQVLAPEQAPRN